MNNNPFTSKTFVTNWMKHFGYQKQPTQFKSIEGVSFVKKSWIPLFVNVGENLTKGLSYKLNPLQTDFKKKVFLIYDVPSYFDKEHQNNEGSLGSIKIDKVFQYQGFLMNLKDFESKEEYIKEQFKTHNKRYIRWSHINRLEACFNVSYRFFYGDMTDSEYKLVFNKFYQLLIERFQGKGTNYHHLNEQKWAFYRELVLPMIRNKEASFFVIYDNNMPIGVNLNYHAENTLFKAITVFDVDYSKFSIGKLSVLKILDWCFENGYQVSDFSKGDFDYKRIWSNTIYDFHYHVLYDSSSLVSLMLGKGLVSFLKTKLWLREKGVNRLYRKVIFRLKGNSVRTLSHGELNYKVKPIGQNDEVMVSETVDLNTVDNQFLKRYVYDFAFKNPEPLANITVHKTSTSNASYVIKGSKNSILLEA
ncbi:MAG: hypothetical protein BM564_12020 [Bacteroidetes bacterium MedPE-SWsnd-G2]|nr:MAG: hypothetical protein BM564_12020 [Bacteroidetes bacterium MedPE-SWsnd-G2]